MNTPFNISSGRQKNFSITCILIVIMFFSIVASGCSGASYGTKLTFAKSNELYYTSNVSSKEAQALGDYLLKEEFFSNDGNERSTQLDKKGSTYEFRMVIKKGLEQEQSTIDLMKLVAAELSKNVFNGETVDVHLCDDNFKTLRVVVAD